MNVGFVLHGERERALELAADLAEFLRARGHDARFRTTDAKRLGLDDLGVPDDDFAAGLDLALSLGGDGTMLHTVDLVAGDAIPVMGINVGQLGYLTTVDPDGARMAIKRFLSGAYSIEHRMLLDVRVDTGDGTSDGADGAGPADPGSTRFQALNEAVVEKTLSGHTIRLAASVDGEYFTTYAADGLIVATPTGSTAYSFSARGPIVAPTHRCMILTPVSPHMLFDRSLVLDPDAALRLEVVGHRPATLSVDGRSLVTLHPGQAIVCTPSRRTAQLVHLGTHDFLGILKNKFGLSER